MAPVTAITAFLPFVDPQNPGARSFCTPMALVLMPSASSYSPISWKITSSAATNYAGSPLQSAGHPAQRSQVMLQKRLRRLADRCREATHHYGSHEERPSTSRAGSESW